MATTFEGSARERLLAAANELFYAEGIHTVGIDRVIERAGVAKASLYAAFGSKEELVRAYLELRSNARRERITRRLETLEGPRARILGIFDLMGETVSAPAFRGCAFVNASAEGPRDPGKSDKIAQVCDGSRAWLRGVFIDLSRQLGARDAEHLGRQLTLLYDGAMVGASVDRDPGVAAEARRAAELLLESYARAPARTASTASTASTKKARRS
ncbi:MAG TPA: helix-turn-helix domain-containing protein [Polyangiaceae bacterium]|jgi:AcrR family transcriptional regulator|nr:helix-turn-helix domain-containing protein [Polyangiaceae bacterium]